MLRRAGVLALSVGLTLTACAGGGGADAGSSETAMMEKSPEAMASGEAKPSADATASGEAMAKGPLSFSAATVAGGSLDVSTLEGTPVVLWFWAPWCTICRGEAPNVSAVAAELGDDVTFIGVAGRGELDAMQGFVTDTEVSGFDHLADVDGSIWSSFGVVSQPSFAFVSPDGTVEKVVGSLGSDALRERAAALIES
jgi:thiol-disulfide isomerase/thioredoxin